MKLLTSAILSLALLGSSVGIASAQEHFEHGHMGGNHIENHFQEHGQDRGFHGEVRRDDHVNVWHNNSNFNVRVNFNNGYFRHNTFGNMPREYYTGYSFFDDGSEYFVYYQNNNYYCQYWDGFNWVQLLDDNGNPYCPGF